MKQKSIDFLDELQELAKDSSGVAAQAIINQVIYAKMLLHLNKSWNQDHFENGRYEKIVLHLETELELKGSKTPDEMQINTVRQQATKPHPEKPKPTCHHCEKPGYYRNQCRQLKKERDQNDTNKISAANKNKKSSNNTGQTNSNTHNNKTVIEGNANSANNRKGRKPRTVYLPCETCGKTIHCTEEFYFGANAADTPPSRNGTPMEQSKNQQQELQIHTIESLQAAAQALN